jgi:hypothetical protein
MKQSRLLDRIDSYIEVITDIYMDAREKANDKNNSKFVILKNKIKWHRLWVVLYFKYRQRRLLEIVGW